MLPNENEELIEAISSLEKVKNISVVKRNKNLFDSVCTTQLKFSQSLVDALTITPGNLTLQEMDLARKNEKVSAIKLIRERTQCGLTDAKGMVEQWQKENNVNPCGGQR